MSGDAHHLRWSIEFLSAFAKVGCPKAAGLAALCQTGQPESCLASCHAWTAPRIVDFGRQAIPSQNLALKGV